MENATKITPDMIEVRDEWLWEFRNTYDATPGSGPIALRASLAVLLADLANNPPMPTKEQTHTWWYECFCSDGHNVILSHAIQQYMRTAFLTPQPEVPEEVKRIIQEWRAGVYAGDSNNLDDLNGLAMKLYNLGRASV